MTTDSNISNSVELVYKTTENLKSYDRLMETHVRVRHINIEGRINDPSSILDVLYGYEFCPASSDYAILVTFGSLRGFKNLVDSSTANPMHDLTTFDLGGYIGQLEIKPGTLIDVYTDTFSINKHDEGIFIYKSKESN